MGAVRTGNLEWAAAGASLPGAAQSGDRCAVVPLSSGTLAIVADGLGHGEQAASAACRVIDTVESAAGELTLLDVARRCHDALIEDSRGAVVSLAYHNPEQGVVTWLGVGNVEGRLLLRTSRGQYLQEYLLLRPGILGRGLPRLQPSIRRVNPGDLLILATDGIAGDFADDLPIDAHVEDIAADILARCGKGTDDALVLVMRYMAHAPSR